MPTIKFTDAEISALREAVKQFVQADDEYISNHDPVRTGLVKLEKAEAEVSLSVKNYAGAVIETHDANPGNASKVVYQEAQRAADDGKANFAAAARVAQTAIKQYDEARAKGHDHADAKEKVSQDVGRRFDDQFRDTQRQERQRSQGMSR